MLLCILLLRAELKPCPAYIANLMLVHIFRIQTWFYWDEGNDSPQHGARISAPDCACDRPTCRITSRCGRTSTVNAVHPWQVQDQAGDVQWRRCGPVCNQVQPANGSVKRGKNVSVNGTTGLMALLVRSYPSEQLGSLSVAFRVRVNLVITIHEAVDVLHRGNVNVKTTRCEIRLP